MRFCKTCVKISLLKTEGHVPFWVTPAWQCPRCKHLLVMNGRESIIEKPSAQDMIHYIGYKDGGAHGHFLLVMAWSDSRYIPEEMLRERLSRKFGGCKGMIGLYRSLGTAA